MSLTFVSIFGTLWQLEPDKYVIELVTGVTSSGHFWNPVPVVLLVQAEFLRVDEGDMPGEYDDMPELESSDEEEEDRYHRRDIVE